MKLRTSFNFHTYVRDPDSKYPSKRYYARKDTHGKKHYLHRDVYEFHYGKIPEGYFVYHIDGNFDNNHISNLVASPRDEHYRRIRMERAKRGTLIEVNCLNCGELFVKRTSKSRFCVKCNHPNIYKKFGKVKDPLL